MCGICSILGRFSNIQEQESVIEKMTSMLDHRGPDGWGLYLAPDVAFGQTRLSIVDLANGHQPMSTVRHVISFNGEIYNYVELRQELEAKGVVFQTTSDTEVLLKMFEVYGTSAFPKLNGQFAFLIWDREERMLVAVRDRYGMRPLYMLEHGGRMYFSSEMKSFDTIEGFEREFEPEMVLEHALLWNTLHDNTVYKGIHSLESGCYAVLRAGQPVRKYRYYEVGDTANPQGALSFNDAKAEFEALLQDSVDLRLRSDVPVGAYLSGGIDSSVIAHLTKHRKRDAFETFSVGFEDSLFDESSFQVEVSDAIQSRHVALNVTQEAIEDNFYDSIYHGERPVFRTAPVPLFLLSNRVNQSDIKVVLTGEGADEYLYGYDTFKELRILQEWSKDRTASEAPNLIRQLYPHLSHYSDPKRFGLMKMYYEGFLDHYDNDLSGLNVRINNNKVMARYLNRDLNIEFDHERLLDRVQQQLPAQFSDWSLLQKNSYWEIRTLLQGYLLSSQGDRMALGHSIEGRYPFLDHRIVDTCFHYPDDFKLNGFSQKHILRETFRGKVPTSVLDRPKRPYMAPDLVSFFRGGKLTPRAEEFLSPSKIEEYGLFDAKFVNRFVRKFKRNIPDEIGYRDNMIITFVLSAQVAKYWARNPKDIALDAEKCTVRLVDYT